MLQEPVEDRGGDDGGAEHFAPIARGPVGCDEDGALLIAARDELEEKMCSVWLERQIAQFVDDQELRLGQRRELVVERTGLVGLRSLRHQSRRGDEEHAIAGKDGFEPERHS